MKALVILPFLLLLSLAFSAEYGVEITINAIVSPPPSMPEPVKLLTSLGVGTVISLFILRFFDIDFSDLKRSIAATIAIAITIMLLLTLI